ELTSSPVRRVVGEDASGEALAVAHETLPAGAGVVPDEGVEAGHGRVERLVRIREAIIVEVDVPLAVAERVRLAAGNLAVHQVERRLWAVAAVAAQGRRARAIDVWPPDRAEAEDAAVSSIPADADAVVSGRRAAVVQVDAVVEEGLAGLLGVG